MRSFAIRPPLPPRRRVRLGERALSRGLVLGVVNATPDSFYEPSRGALARVEQLVAEGATAIDLGAESTRPGAQDVPEREEMKRLLPLIERIRRRFPNLLLSIDTRKAGVAREALRRGADIVNDVSALRHDPAMASVAAEAGCPVILMHMRGTPQTMQRRPRYRHVVDEVVAFLSERLRFAVREGIRERQVWLDPGIGFGKTLAHNLLLLKHLHRIAALGRPVVIGVSRKSFIGRILATGGEPRPAEERLSGSCAASLWALAEGASVIRTHDVRATADAVRVWQAIGGAAS